MQAFVVDQKGSITYREGGSAVTARVAVVPVFAGTTVNGSLTLHTSSRYPGRLSVSAPLISHEELVTGLWRKLVPAWKWRRSKQLSGVLATIGGHMRSVEFFVTEMVRADLWASVLITSWENMCAQCSARHWDSPDHLHGALARAKDLLLKRYPAWMGKSRPQALAAAVLGLPLSITNRDLTLDGDSVESVVNNAPVALTFVGDGSVVRLSFTGLFLNALCTEALATTAFQGTLRTLLRPLASPIDYHLSPSGFEVMCAEVFAVFMMGAAYAPGPVRLGDMFRGAIFAPSAHHSGDEMRAFHVVSEDATRASAELPGAKVCVVKALHQFPKYPVQDVRTNEGVSFFGQPCVVVNADQASFSDFCTRLPSGLFLHGQSKRLMSSKGKVTAALVRAEAVTVRADLSTFSSSCMGDEDVDLQHHILVLLSLGYCDGGKSEAATARAARLMSDLETEPPELSSVVVARGAGFEELFGPLANSLPLRPSSYVHVCCASAPDGFVVHGSPCLFPSACFSPQDLIGCQ